MTTPYWTFDLNPYLFEVKTLPWDILLSPLCLVLFFFVVVGGWCMARFALPQQSSWSVGLQNTFLYGGFCAVALGVLHFMGINWGPRWYSIMYILSFALVYGACAYWISKKRLMMTEHMLTMLLVSCLLGLLIGARLGYVFVYNWDYYSLHPLNIIATWEGGLSFHGGIVGIWLALYLYTRHYRMPFFHLTDRLVLLIPLCIALGRMGNFMNGELWGRVIESPVPWAVIFPSGGPLPRHPSQIYQALTEGLLLFVTLFVISRFKHREGTLSACFLMFYCVYRFIMEYFRAADAQINYLYLNAWDWAPLGTYPGTAWWQMVTMGQILCITFFFVGVGMFWYSRKSILECSIQWNQRIQRFFNSKAKGA